ncbi:oxidoreductase-like domain-containing protein [Moraxella caprae]|nr:oxidoreductase-like domain-containing protein [Moraxella caprae]
MPPPPEPPEDYECCDNGCDELCVFEIYKMQKADYDAKWGHVIDKNE